MAYQLMSEDRKNKLEQLRPQLIERIRFSDTLLWPKLRSLGVVTPLQNETYRDKPNHVQAEWLLDHISRRTDQDYNRLCEALTETGQEFLANQLRIQDEKSAKGKYGAEFLRLRNRIASHYKEINGKIPRWPYGQGQHDVDFDELYVPGSLLDMKTKENVDNMEKVLHKEKKKRVLIQGRPGSGKTTFVNKSLISWAKDILKTEEEGADTPKNEHYAIVLLIALQNVEPATALKDVILEQICWQHPEDATKVIEFLDENPEDVLVFIDGLDDYEPSTSPIFTSIIKGETYPDVSRVVTSRHLQVGTELDQLIKHYKHFLEIPGFNQDQIGLYIQKYFAKLSSKPRKRKKSTEDEDTVTSLQSEIEDMELQSLCSVPLYMNLICIVWETGKELGSSRTDFLIKVLKFTLDIHKNKTHPLAVVDLQNLGEYHDLTVSCGILALMSLLGEENQFTVATGDAQSSQEEVVEKAYEIGLVIRTTPEGFETDTNLMFADPSLGAFLAAYAIVYSQEHLNMFIGHVNTMIRIHECRHAIVFTCGLSGSHGNYILHHCIKVVMETTKFPTSAECPGFNHEVWNEDDERMDHPDLNGPSDDISGFLHDCILQFKDLELIEIPLPPKITFDFETEQADSLLLLCSRMKSKQMVKDMAIIGHLSDDDTNKIFSMIEAQGISSLYLDCDEVQDVEVLAEYISQMEDLRHFKVAIENVSEEESEQLLTALSHCTELRTLSVQDLDFDSCLETFPEQVNNLADLVSLYLEDVDISVMGQASISLVNHENLATLSLVDTSVTIDQIIAMCGEMPSSCPKLLYLAIEGNDISGAEYHIGQALSELSMMKVLCLNKCNMEKKGLHHIMQDIPESLLLLNVDENPIDDVSYLSENQDLFQNIEVFQLMDTAVPDSDIKEMAESNEEDYPVFIYDSDTKNEFDEDVIEILASVRKECASRQE